jgi:cell division protein FtsZ
MGGGTGTGAAPVVARLAREMNILTVGIVTKPFAFEGKRRMTQAMAGIEALSEHVDSLIIIPNERLKQVSDTRITLANAFEVVDDVLRHGVQSISELINVDGFINLDFADVTSVMKDAGFAHMGVGVASGKDKAELAAKAAISSPLLETSIRGASGIVISMYVSPDVGLEDVDTAAAMITNEANPEANVIWGVAFDEELEDSMRVTIIATGFDKNVEGATTVAAQPATSAPAPAPVKQGITIGRIDAAPTPITPAAPATVVQPAAEAAPKKDEGTISDSDFDDIMEVLRKSKGRSDFRGRR